MEITHEEEKGFSKLKIEEVLFVRARKRKVYDLSKGEYMCEAIERATILKNTKYYILREN
jgi:hypothetical protein